MCEYIDREETISNNTFGKWKWGHGEFLFFTFFMVQLKSLSISVQILSYAVFLGDMP